MNGIPGQDDGVEYDAFISYNHTADFDLAPHLQRGLHRLGKPFWRRHAMNVFRDRTSLAASSGVWSSIQMKLASSRWFILLASPLAAASPWVCKEVQWWLDNRGTSRLLIVVTAGNLDWNDDEADFAWENTDCLPRLLSHRFSEPPNYVDLRWATEREILSLRHAGFRAAILDLAAPIRDQRKEEIDGEDVRQHRLTQRVLAAATTAGLVLTAGIAVAGWLAVQNAQLARANESLALSRQAAAEAQLALREGRLAKGTDAALRAMEAAPTHEARSAMFEAWLAATPVDQVVDGFDDIGALTYLERGSVLRVWQRTGRLTNWDLDRAAPQSDHRIDLPARTTASAFSADTKSLAVGDAQGRITLVNAAAASVLGTLPAPQEDTGSVIAVAWHPTEPILAVGYQGSPGLRLWDLRTRALAKVQPRLDGDSIEDTYWTGVAFSADGRQLAAVNGLPGARDGVWDVISGKVVHLRPGAGSFSQPSAVAFVAGADDRGVGSSPLFALGWTDGTAGVAGHPAHAHDERVTRLLAVGDRLVSAGDDGLVQVSDRGSQASRRLIGWTRASIGALAASPDGLTIAVGGVDGSLVIYRLYEGDSIGRTTNNGVTMRRLGDCCLLALQRREDKSQRVALLDAIDGRVVAEPRDALQRWLGSSDTPAFAMADGKFALLDQTSPRRGWLVVQAPANMAVQALGLNSNQVYLKSFSPPRLVLMDLERPGTVVDVSPGPGGLGLLSPVPGGGWLEKRGLDLVLRDNATGKPLPAGFRLPPLRDDDATHELAWSPDGNWLLAGEPLRMTLMQKSTTGLFVPGFGDSHFSARFSRDARWLLSEHAREGWQLRDLSQGGSLRFPRAQADPSQPARRIKFARLSDNGGVLLLLREGGAVSWLRPTEAGSRESALAVPPAKSIAIDASGRWAVALHEDGASVVDLSEPRQRPITLDGYGEPLTFGPQSASLAISSAGERTATVVHFDTGRTMRLEPAMPRHLDDLAFSSDGNVLVVIDNDGNHAVWDAVNGRRLGEVARGSGADEDQRYRLRRPAQDRVLGPDLVKSPLLLDEPAWQDSLCSRISTASAESTDDLRPSASHSAFSAWCSPFRQARKILRQ